MFRLHAYQKKNEVLTVVVIWNVWVASLYSAIQLAKRAYVIVPNTGILISRRVLQEKHTAVLVPLISV
jgi:hypothetical protein